MPDSSHDDLPTEFHLLTAPGGRGRRIANWLERHRPLARRVGWPLAIVVVARAMLDALERTDFHAYYDAARAVVEGSSLYETDRIAYLYPPTLAVVLSPLALLPEWVGTVLGIAAIAVGFGFGMRLCLDLAGVRRYGERILLGAIVAASIFRPLDSELGNAQANFLTLLFLAFTVRWLIAERPRAAGVALAAAISIKLTPVLLVLYLAAIRRWRVVVATIVTAAILLVVLPAVALGWQRGVNDWWRQQFVPLYRQSVATAAAGELHAALPADEVLGHSMRATVHRYLTRTDASVVDTSKSSRHGPVFVNLAEARPQTAERVYQGLAVAMLALTWWVAGRRPPRDGPGLLAQISVWIALMPIISPFTRKAHLLVLAIVFATCWARCLSGPRRPLGTVLLVTAAVAVNLTASGFVGRPLSVHVQAYGAVCLGMILAWAAAMVLARDRFAPAGWTNGLVVVATRLSANPLPNSLKASPIRSTPRKKA